MQRFFSIFFKKLEINQKKLSKLLKKLFFFAKSKNQRSCLFPISGGGAGSRAGEAQRIEFFYIFSETLKHKKEKYRVPSLYKLFLEIFFSTEDLWIKISVYSTVTTRLCLCTKQKTTMRRIWTCQNYWMIPMIPMMKCLLLWTPTLTTVTQRQPVLSSI